MVEKGKIIFRYEGDYNREVQKLIVDKYADKPVHIWTDIWEDNDSMKIQINELKGE